MPTTYTEDEKRRLMEQLGFTLIAIKSTAMSDAYQPNSNPVES